jgi:hypothetical protein
MSPSAREASARFDLPGRHQVRGQFPRRLIWPSSRLNLNRKTMGLPGTFPRTSALTSTLAPLKETAFTSALSSYFAVVASIHVRIASGLDDHDLHLSQQRKRKSLRRPWRSPWRSCRKNSSLSWMAEFRSCLVVTCEWVRLRRRLGSVACAMCGNPAIRPT